ncbi:hypothetical protein [Allokutzneria oryzae]|uniref:Uncharacterized protein n=1 Tax=Allokutzneria oryzae TaxID=1378989 RepID=A0ABV5ZVR6_9PSEU
MAEERCKHDLPTGTCVDCRPLPPGVRARVWVTKGGSVFHNDQQCWMLLDGQRKSARQGKETHAAESVSWAEAMTRGLGSCKGCCTEAWLSRNRQPPTEKQDELKPCFVLIDGHWVPGHLVWRGRDEAGAWQAEVTYQALGRTHKKVVSSQFVKQR